MKSKFQACIRPLQNLLITWGISPNQITVFTCILCLIYAALLAWSSFTSILLITLPLFMLLRMALNALDGMVASASNNQTTLGAVLNEVCDVISDAALFSAFLLLLPAYHSIWWLLTLLALLTEYVSLAVFQANRVRSHSGPFGKSDRAVYLAILAVILWVYPEFLYNTSAWVLSYIILGLLLVTITIWNRFSSLSE